ncbi:MAG: cell wall hydrolase [Pseudomonadota bacterium]
MLTFWASLWQVSHRFLSGFIALAVVLSMLALMGMTRGNASSRFQVTSLPTSTPIEMSVVDQFAIDAGLYTPLPMAPLSERLTVTDPFEQLTRIGLDGYGLRQKASLMEVDVTPVAALDLSQIDPDSLDREERRCMTQAIYYEARNQSLAGQMAVADVVLNRVNSRRYPNSVCEVVYQGSERRTGCQFSFTCDGSLQKRVETRAMFRSQVLATAVLGGFHLPLSLDATNYHATYVSPYWAPKLAETVQIGDHIFYKRG